MKWVITANSNQCRIYDYQKEKLTLLKEIKHPENKLKDSEILADRQGRYHAGNGGQGAFSQAQDPAAIQIDNFARELAHYLDEGRNNQSYKQLFLIMPPQMEGLLLQHLNKHIKPLIRKVIQKNVMHCDERELLTFLA